MEQTTRNQIEYKNRGQAIRHSISIHFIPFRNTVPLPYVFNKQVNAKSSFSIPHRLSEAGKSSTRPLASTPSDLPFTASLSPTRSLHRSHTHRVIHRRRHHPSLIIDLSIHHLLILLSKLRSLLRRCQTARRRHVRHPGHRQRVLRHHLHPNLRLPPTFPRQ